MSQPSRYGESLAGCQHIPLQRNAPLYRHVAVDCAVPGGSHLNRRASISRVRDDTHRPSHLRDCITLDSPSRLRNIIAPELALGNDSKMASTPPSPAAVTDIDTPTLKAQASPVTEAANVFGPTQRVNFLAPTTNTPGHLDVPNPTPTNERSDSGDSKVDANTPRTPQSEQNPRSVKNITCHWWATKMCRYTEGECLYAHSIQKTIAEQPRKLDPNGKSMIFHLAIYI